MRLTCTLLGLLLSLSLFSQTFSSTNPAYITAVKAGEAALLAGDYDQCLLHYDTAFNIKQTSFLSTMRAAACAHSAGEEVLRDTFLNRASALNAKMARQVFYNEEFNYLRETPFAEMVEARFLAAFPDYDKALVAELARVRESDQAQRGIMQQVSQQHGWQSPQMDSLWAIQNVTDSINTLYITKLIDERGYPGQSVAGNQASTAFLVIQHADLAVQEKYLPVLQQAADAGELSRSSLALLIDRVEMRNDRPQIYGSQVRTDKETGEAYFAPIKNPHKIDSIRTTVGLGPIQDYGSRWEITWDPDKHLARRKE